MGMTQSPNWAQSALEEVFEDMLQECVECFINNVAMFSNESEDDPWKHHITNLDVVLTRLEENGFTVYPAKCLFAVQEAPF